MNRKTLAVLMIVLAAGLLVYWAVAGGEYYTLTEVPVTTTDELFGTTTTEWKEEFRPGLLDMIAPAAGVLLVISALLFWSAARKRRNDAASVSAGGQRTV